MAALIFLLVFILGVPALFFFSIRSDLKKDRQEKEDCDRKSSKWLEEQHKLPKYAVEIKTKEQNCFLFTGIFEPKSEVKHLFHYYVDSKTSLEKAQKFIEGSIELGRYYHEENNTFIPMCEILSMQAKQVIL